MTKRRTTQTREAISALADDWWVCRCGNEADREGFFPCDRSGRHVEPTAEAWPEPLYVCDRCGRIIAHGTRQVVGRSRSCTDCGDSDSRVRTEACAGESLTCGHLQDIGPDE